MSTEYTKNDTNNIYFLNDRNIATTLNDEIAKNAIPSNELFKEKYNELTATDNKISVKLENLSGFANTISSDLDTKTKKALDDAKAYTNEVSGGISVIIDSNRTSDKNELSNVLSSYTNKQVGDLSTSLSNTVEEKFVNVSGDTITGELKVDKVLATELSSGDINISGNISISGKKVIIGNSSAKYDNMFVWNADEGNYEGNTVDSNTGKTFNINPAHGSKGFFIGNESLSDIIKNDTQLTATDIRNEINAVSSLMIEKYALSDDVKSEIDRIDNTGYLISSDFDFEYKDQKIWLSAGNKVVSIDAGDFIKDGMLLSAILVQQKEDTGEFGQFLKLIFNTDSETTPIYVDLQKLVDIYEGQNGIVVTPIDNKFIITPNHEIVAKTSDVILLSSHTQDIQNYIKNLSGEPNGILPIIKNDINDLSVNHGKDIESLYESIRNNATFAGTINISKSKIDDFKNGKWDGRISSLLEESNAVLFRHVKNGDIYQVNMDSGFNTEYDNSAFGLASRYFDTTDNPSIRLSHKDLIVVYKPITDDKIELTEENVHQYIKILPSVRLYEYYNLSVTVSSDYFWLSGGNNIENNHVISGDNYFKDINYFENISVQNISATDTITEKLSAIDAKINDISATNAVIEDISVVNGLSGDWSKIVDSNTIFSLFNLCTAVSSKIFIDNRIDEGGIKGTSDLSIVKLSKDEFDERVVTYNQLSDNILYIVDSDYIDAYGQVMKNLTMSDLSGREASEAVNKSYFENVVSDISNYLSDEISNEIDRAVAYEKYLSDEISLSANNLCVELSNEIDRAVAYEKYLSDEISLSANNLCIALSNEIDRAIAYEKYLSDEISNEVVRAVAYEKYLSDEIKLNDADIKYLSDEISLSANNLCIALSNENKQVTILTNNLTSNYIEKTTIKSAISALTLESQLSDVIIALSILNNSL